MILGLLTALAAIFVFGTVVLIHELGHFLAARRYGIFVQEFSIGFGPALWSRVRGGTRFSVRLIPLGGYNAMPGEESEADPPAGSRAAQSTAVSGRLFSEAGPWQRFFVILSGAAIYLGAHFMLNVGGVSALLPLTGVPLLFISDGGSALVSAFITMGLCQHVSAKINTTELAEKQ